MPKIKRTKTYTGPQYRTNPLSIYFSPKDDIRLRAAYNIVNPHGGESVSWLEVARQYRNLLQAKCQASGLPALSDEQLEVYTNPNRLRDRYINDLAPSPTGDLNLVDNEILGRIDEPTETERLQQALDSTTAKLMRTKSQLTQAWQTLHAKENEFKTETTAVRTKLKKASQTLDRREAELNKKEADLARREAAIKRAEQRQPKSEARQQAASTWSLRR